MDIHGCDQMMKELDLEYDTKLLPTQHKPWLWSGKDPSCGKVLNIWWGLRGINIFLSPPDTTYSPVITRARTSWVCLFATLWRTQLPLLPSSFPATFSKPMTFGSTPAVHTNVSSYTRSQVCNYVNLKNEIINKRKFTLKLSSYIVWMSLTTNIFF